MPPQAMSDVLHDEATQVWHWALCVPLVHCALHAWVVQSPSAAAQSAHGLEIPALPWMQVLIAVMSVMFDTVQPMRSAAKVAWCTPSAAWSAASRQAGCGSAGWRPMIAAQPSPTPIAAATP